MEGRPIKKMGLPFWTEEKISFGRIFQKKYLRRKENCVTILLTQV